MARTPHAKNKRQPDSAPERDRASGRVAVEPIVAEGYAWWSTRPLHVLVFLLPLLIAYEIGLVVYLGAEGGPGAGPDVAARQIFVRLFASMGVGGAHVPALLMVAILVAWHLIARDKWRIRPGTLAGMAGEALLWMFPLLVLGAIGPGAIESLLAQATEAGAPGTGNGGLESLSWQSRLTLSIGAGLYEDLLCRLVAIALLHLILADVLTLPEWQARLGAVLGSAVLFAMLHDLNGPDGSINWSIAGTYVAAGLYLAIVYLWRGLGICVACHALYDIVVLVIAPAVLPAAQGSGAG